MSVSLVNDTKKSFDVERQILDILGEHPRIVRFLGISQDPQALLLAEATGGDLQTYLDQHADTYSSIPLPLRQKWCRQAAEAIDYIHTKGVIHSDLRPDNYLLHGGAPGPDLLLCDFGGSTCGNEIDGGHLPDAGFFNPSKPWISTKATDIFSLGSIFYTIITGHWPYRSPSSSEQEGGAFASVEEQLAYVDLADGCFSRG